MARVQGFSMNTVGWIALGGMALYLLARRAVANVLLTVGNAAYRIEWLPTPVAFVTFPCTIENRNPVAVTINRFDGYLTYNRQPLGNVTIDQPIAVPRNGTATFNVTVRVPGLSLVQTIIDLATTGQILGVLRIEGYLQIPQLNVPIPVNTPVQLAA